MVQSKNWAVGLNLELGSSQETGHQYALESWGHYRVEPALCSGRAICKDESMTLKPVANGMWTSKAFISCDYLKCWAPPKC